MIIFVSKATCPRAAEISSHITSSLSILPSLKFKDLSSVCKIEEIVIITQSHKSKILSQFFSLGSLYHAIFALTSSNHVEIGALGVLELTLVKMLIPF